MLEHMRHWVVPDQQDPPNPEEHAPLLPPLPQSPETEMSEQLEGHDIACALAGKNKTIPTAIAKKTAKRKTSFKLPDIF